MAWGCRLADMRSSACILQGGKVVAGERKDSRDKNERKAWIFTVFCVYQITLILPFDLYSVSFSRKYKKGSFSLGHSGAMLEFCSRNVPFFVDLIDHVVHFTHAHINNHTATMEKGLGHLWKTWKIHFNLTSNTDTLITGTLKDFKFSACSIFSR